MGICCSCYQSTSSAGNTAKMILEDGRLEEFSYPVKVSRILEKNSSNSFICNSNDIDLDNILCAVDDEEELQPGELYFVLPLSLLNCPLSAEDMGALAVRASLAIKGSRGSGVECLGFGCGFGMTRKMDSIVFNSRRVGVDGVADGSGGGDGRFVDVDHGSELESLAKRTGKRAGRGRSFRSKLNLILEE